MSEVLSGALTPHDAVKKLMGRDPTVET